MCSIRILRSDVADAILLALAIGHIRSAENPTSLNYVGQDPNSGHLLGLAQIIYPRFGFQQK
jgi:hypothetical protein